MPNTRKVLDKAIRACDSDWQSDYDKWKELYKKALIAGKNAQNIFDKAGQETKESKAAEKEWKNANKAQSDFIINIGSKYANNKDDLIKLIHKYENSTSTAPYFQALRPDGPTCWGLMAILRKMK